MAVTTTSKTVNLKTIVRPSLTASCPISPVHLGTFFSNVRNFNTSSVTVTCTITHNRRTGNISIVSVPASNTIMLSSENGDTWPNNFSNFTTTSGIHSGTFSTGITLSNPARGSFTFAFDSRAESPIPSTIPDGTYVGSHTLTFSLI